MDQEPLLPASPTQIEKAQAVSVTPPTNEYPNGFKRFSLGELELTVLSDGYIRQSPVHPFLAPLAQPDEVSKQLEAAFRSTEVLDSALNILVVKTKDRLILLDAGLGTFAGPTQGYLLQSLASAGFTAADFTDIVLSHAHIDHIGGLVDAQHQLVFDNATIYIAKVEYDFWQQATLADFKNSPVYQMPDFVHQTITNIQTVLNLLASRIQFIDINNGLYGIFSFEIAPGHTPGHTLITIHSEGESLLNIVDLIQSDAVLFAHPEWGFFGDADIQQAIESRVTILKRLSALRMKTFVYHLPWPGLGHVRQKGAAFEWVPDVYAVP